MQTFIHLTDEQLDALRAFNVRHGDSWAIRSVTTLPEDDDTPRDPEVIEVGIDPFQTSRAFERFITRAGKIKRWDEDTDTYVDATEAPEIGSLTMTNGATRVFHY